MEKNNNTPNDSPALRLKAEEILKSRSAGVTSLPTEAELLKLVHEFDVHQVELELQNEELIRAITEARDAVDLYDFAPVGYFTLSKAGIINRHNLSGAAMLGKERARLENHLFTPYISSDTASIFDHFFHNVFNKLTVQSCEVTLSVNNNSPVFVQITGIATGKADQCLLTLNDITHRRQVEEAGKLSELRYRTMFADSPEPMWIFDLETLAFLEVNQAAVFLYGYSAEEFLSMTIKDIRPMEDIAILLKSVEPTNRTYNQLGEFRHIKKNGEIIDVLITWHSVIFKGRKARHVLVNDVTKRKRAERAMQNEKRNFQSVFESSPVPLLVIDETTNITMVNLAAIKFCGGTVSEILQHRPGEALQCIHSSKDPRGCGYSRDCKLCVVRNSIENLIAKGGSIEGAVVVFELFLNGKPRKVWVTIGVEPLMLNGKDHWCIAMGDITPRILAEEALKESEEKYRLIVENIGEGFCLVNSDEQFLLANKAAEMIFGVGPGCLVNMNLNQFVSKEQSEIVQRETSLRTHGIQSVYELDIIQPGGKIRTISLTAVPMNDKEGIFFGTYGIFRDITEQKKAEDDLRKSEITMNVILQSTADGILAINSNGKVIKTNSRFSELWHIPKDLIDLEDDHAMISFVMDQLTNSEEFIEKVQKLNQSADEDLDYLYFKDGRIFERFSAPMHMEDSSIGRVWSFRDISERKLAETALLESEKLFRSVLESVSLVGVMLDRNGRITLCNDFLLGLTGWTREEVIHKNWFDWFIPEKIRTTLEFFQSSIQKNEISEHYENEIITRTGDLRLIAWNNIILHDHLGAVSGIASIGEDITDRKRMEAEVKYKNEELQKLNATKDKFFSIIAHDLKSPFNSILGFSQILEEQMREKDYTAIEKYSKIIYESSERAVKLLMNLMEWSRSQTGRMEFNPEYCEMVELIQEVTILLDGSALQKLITINRVLPHTIRIFADKAMISTVVRNLISNAIKFTMPGGTITISMEQTQTELVFTVQDTGIGISKSGMEKLFRIEESFSTPGTQKEKGTGLGLILCKDFVELHGGKIGVESELGKGSAFKFSILF